YVILGAILLILFLVRIKGKCQEVSFGDEGNTLDRTRLAAYLVLFAVSVSAVLRLIPYEYVFIIVMVAMVILAPRKTFGIDWGLILTFIFLFIFTGNLASVDVVHEALTDLLSWNAVVASALVSQFISNVPATVMLSNFTSDWSALLAGVNIGGFGTPIASMASIITLRIYSKEKDADRVGFLKNFAFINVIMLVALIACSYLL
ncbi:MAG: hypothetical protein MJZ21_03855, partial [archaeon]|nr:hypothetical protein [archaeon]